jgi:hypothetical protein
MVSPGQSKYYLDQLPEKKLSKCLEKRRSYPAAFAKYRFYLDIRSARAKAALVEDILALGGVSKFYTVILLMWLPNDSQKSLDRQDMSERLYNFLYTYPILFSLKGMSHENVGELRVWGVSLGSK